MKNKRGFIVVWIIFAAVIFAVLLIAYLLSNKIVNALGSKWIIYGAAFVLVVIFREFVLQVLLTIWKGITALLHIIGV